MEAQLRAKAVADHAHRKRELEMDSTKQEKALLPSLLDRIFNS
jgi:hypothetical protein